MHSTVILAIHMDVMTGVWCRYQGLVQVPGMIVASSVVHMLVRDMPYTPPFFHMLEHKFDLRLPTTSL